MNSTPTKCEVPENFYTHTTEGHWNSEGERVSTAIIYKGKYEAKLEIPGGREGSNVETFHGGGMDIFKEINTECKKSLRKSKGLVISKANNFKHSFKTTREFPEGWVRISTSKSFFV